MSNLTDNNIKTQFIKAIDSCTGKTYYGKVIASSKCYVTVEIKNYYSNGNPLIQKLWKRTDRAMTCDDVWSLNFYFISAEEVK